MAKLLDLDLGLDLDETPVTTRPIKMFGQEWTLVCDLNSFALSNLTTGDPQALVQFLNSIIVEDQRVEFGKALSSVPNLTPEKLGTILGKLVEAAGERPTTQPSASQRGASNPRTSQKSAAGSSKARAVRSVR